MTTSNTIQTTGKLQIVEQLKNSLYGNPRYHVAVVDDQSNMTAFYTAPNSSYGYCITNYRDKQVTVDLAVKRGKLTLIDISLA